MSYKIGLEVPRDGMSPLVIFECMPDGRYAARTKRHVIGEHDFVHEEGVSPQEGSVVKLRDGREIVLLCQRKSGNWENTWNDRIELTERQIEEALADSNAAEIYSSVATRRERGGNSSNIRYLPTRTTPRKE